MNSRARTPRRNDLRVEFPFLVPCHCSETITSSLVTIFGLSFNQYCQCRSRYPLKHLEFFRSLAFNPGITGWFQDFPGIQPFFNAEIPGRRILTFIDIFNRFYLFFLDLSHILKKCSVVRSATCRLQL